jgi:hypothetical protein
MNVVLAHASEQSVAADGAHLPQLNRCGIFAQFLVRFNTKGDTR